MRTLLNLAVTLLVVGLLLGGGCGSDDSPTGPANGGDDPEPDDFTTSGVAAALDAMLAVDTLYHQVRADQGDAAAGQAAVASLEANPAVAASGISSDGTVWARFRHGLRVAIITQGRGVAPLARRAPEPDKDGGEATGAAVVMTPFAHRWGSANEDAVAGMIDTCFGASTSSRTVRYSDGEVTIQRLSEVLSQGPGVLLYSSHGCLVPVDASTEWTALLTGQSASSVAMAQLMVDHYLAGATGVGLDWRVMAAVEHGTLYLAVTPAFIAAHASFDGLEGLNNGCKSLVYACCCNSGRLGCGLQEAFINAGVDMYLGWSDTVSVGFAGDAQQRFFRQAIDTCTVDEAYNAMGSLDDPGSPARLMLYQAPAMEPMMLRAQMQFTKDGTARRGYSVGVAVDDGVTMVSCVAGQAMQMPSWSVTVHMPGTGAGTWDCVGQEDAMIMLLDFDSMQVYVVQQDQVGVDGTIEVSRNDGDLISGTFSGTLGHWVDGQDPEVDPPASTVSIEGGVFKHVGMRF
jgi:hypothetical protein